MRSSAGRRDHAAESAGDGEALVVGHDQQHVGRTLGRHHARRPPGCRLQRVALDLAAERGARRWELIAGDAGRRGGGTERAGDLRWIRLRFGGGFSSGGADATCERSTKPTRETPFTSVAISSQLSRTDSTRKRESFSRTYNFRSGLQRDARSRDHNNATRSDCLGDARHGLWGLSNDKAGRIDECQDGGQQ